MHSELRPDDEISLAPIVEVVGKLPQLGAILPYGRSELRTVKILLNAGSGQVIGVFETQGGIEPEEHRTDLDIVIVKDGGFLPLGQQPIALPGGRAADIRRPHSAAIHEIIFKERGPAIVIAAGTKIASSRLKNGRGTVPATRRTNPRCSPLPRRFRRNRRIARRSRHTPPKLPVLEPKGFQWHRSRAARR